MKVVMIGGDAAGMSAASKVRRSLPDAQVVVFERTKETSYGAVSYTHLEVYKRQVVLR